MPRLATRWKAPESRSANCRAANAYASLSAARRAGVSGPSCSHCARAQSALAAHPNVLSCLVVGVPHEDWGEAVKAVVELKPGQQVTAAELEILCRATLAGYKIPKSFEFWQEIPRSPVGKVLKREVRARYWQARGKQI